MKRLKLLGNQTEGKLFVLSAPAGTGKTTLVQMLTKEFSCILASISYTTRLPRWSEKNGVDYYFISKEEFSEKVQRNEFLEHVNVFGHQYGTSKAWVDERRKKGNHVILVIDTQGALQLMGKEEAVFIFLLPPSLEELKNRLMLRKTECKEKVEKRLSWAEKELEVAHKYDYQIVNDDLQIAYQVLRSILIAEEHHSPRKK